MNALISPQDMKVIGGSMFGVSVVPINLDDLAENELLERLERLWGNQNVRLDDTTLFNLWEAGFLNIEKIKNYLIKEM